MIYSKCVKLPTKNTVSGELSLKNKEIKTFSDRSKPREFITTRTALQEMLKVWLQVEMKEW